MADMYDLLGFSNYECDLWTGASMEEFEKEVEKRKARYLQKHGITVEEALERRRKAGLSID